ncbi:hypothetical protein D3C80_1770080 [compost metagenome]
MEVLSATTSSGQDAQQSSQVDQNQDEQALPSTLTLLVTPEQAKLLADLENQSKLHAALVYRGDANTAKAFTDQQDAYFAAKTVQQEEGAHEE